MINNTDLVEIIYSKSIKEYVIILKRFPDKPVVIFKGFDEIYDLCNNVVDHVEIYHNSRKYLINNTYNRLYLSNGNNRTSCLKVYALKPVRVIDTVEITNLEKFEIINKVLELREILIERGE